MLCEQVREHLSAYLDKELAGDLSAAVRGHLESCAECRTLADELRATVGLVGRLPVHPAPAHVVADVQREIERRLILAAPAAPEGQLQERTLPLRRARLWPRIAAVAAAIVLAAGIGLLAWLSSTGVHQEHLTVAMAPAPREPAPAPEAGVAERAKDAAAKSESLADTLAAAGGRAEVRKDADSELAYRDGGTLKQAPAAAASAPALVGGDLLAESVSGTPGASAGEPNRFTGGALLAKPGGGAADLAVANAPSGPAAAPAAALRTSTTSGYYINGAPSGPAAAPAAAAPVLGRPPAVAGPAALQPLFEKAAVPAEAPAPAAPAPLTTPTTAAPVRLAEAPPAKPAAPAPAAETPAAEMLAPIAATTAKAVPAEKAEPPAAARGVVEMARSAKLPAGAPVGAPAGAHAGAPADAPAAVQQVMNDYIDGDADLSEVGRVANRDNLSRVQNQLVIRADSVDDAGKNLVRLFGDNGWQPLAKDEGTARSGGARAMKKGAAQPAPQAEAKSAEALTPAVEAKPAAPPAPPAEAKGAAPPAPQAEAKIAEAPAPPAWRGKVAAEAEAARRQSGRARLPGVYYLASRNGEEVWVVLADPDSLSQFSTRLAQTDGMTVGMDSSDEFRAVASLQNRLRQYGAAKPAEAGNAKPAEDKALGQVQAKTDLAKGSGAGAPAREASPKVAEGAGKEQRDRSGLDEKRETTQALGADQRQVAQPGQQAAPGAAQGGAPRQAPATPSVQAGYSAAGDRQAQSAENREEAGLQSQTRTPAAAGAFSWKTADGTRIQALPLPGNQVLVVIRVTQVRAAEASQAAPPAAAQPAAPARQP